MSTAPIPNFGLASFSQEGDFYQDALLSDGHHVVTRKAQAALAVGKRSRGLVVKLDVSANAITIPAAATDCNAVLAENIDPVAAGGTVECIVYVSGKMKENAMDFGALGKKECAEALRSVGILVESVMNKDGQIPKLGG